MYYKSRENYCELRKISDTLKNVVYNEKIEHLE
jgi:hypothetical protein